MNKVAIIGIISVVVIGAVFSAVNAIFRQVTLKAIAEESGLSKKEVTQRFNAFTKEYKLMAKAGMSKEDLQQKTIDFYDSLSKCGKAS
jgi:transcription initiation factor TFIIIB Brf1 subunit/transcription initiation factor TFIIB